MQGKKIITILFLTYSCLLATKTMAGCPKIESMREGKFFYAEGNQLSYYFIEGYIKENNKIRFMFAYPLNAHTVEEALLKGNDALKNNHIEFLGGGNECIYNIVIDNIDTKLELGGYALSPHSYR